MIIWAIPFCVTLYCILAAMTAGLFDRWCCDETADHAWLCVFWPVLWFGYLLLYLPWKLARGK